MTLPVRDAGATQQTVVADGRTDFLLGQSTQEAFADTLVAMQHSGFCQRREKQVKLVSATSVSLVQPAVPRLFAGDLLQECT